MFFFKLATAWCLIENAPKCSSSPNLDTIILSNTFSLEKGTLKLMQNGCEQWNKENCYTEKYRWKDWRVGLNKRNESEAKYGLL